MASRLEAGAKSPHNPYEHPNAVGVRADLGRAEMVGVAPGGVPQAPAIGGAALHCCDQAAVRADEVGINLAL